MDIYKAIKYLDKHKITAEKNGSDYIITNPQNVALRVTEQAVIDYALNLRNPPKIKSLVGDFHKSYWG